MKLGWRKKMSEEHQVFVCATSNIVAESIKLKKLWYQV